MSNQPYGGTVNDPRRMQSSSSWPPRTLEQLRALVNDPVVQESTAIEVKAALPARNKNADLATDICAMTVEGGLIVYGIQEAANRQLTAAPISLQGTVERISNIAHALVAEPPMFDAYTVPVDARSGFVVVNVPPSDRAPHMVQAKGRWRYYGRGPGGNRELGEGEVARLYERRGRSLPDDESIRARLRDAAPPLYPGAAALHVFVQPTASDAGMLRRAWGQDADNPQLRLHDAVTATRASAQFRQPSVPAFTYLIGGAIVPTVAGWMIRHDEGEGSRFDLEVARTGDVRFFCDGVARQRSSEVILSKVLTARDDAIAQMTTHAVVMAGQLYRDAGYFGTADVHVLLIGLSGAFSALSHELSQVNLQSRAGANLPEPYQARAQHTARSLLTDPLNVARSVVGPFLDALRRGGPDPFM